MQGDVLFGAIARGMMVDWGKQICFWVAVLGFFDPEFGQIRDQRDVFPPYSYKKGIKSSRSLISFHVALVGNHALILRRANHRQQPA